MIYCEQGYDTGAPASQCQSLATGMLFVLLSLFQWRGSGSALWETSWIWISMEDSDPFPDCHAARKTQFKFKIFSLQIMPEQSLKANKKSNVSMKTLYNKYLMRPIFSFWFRIRIKADADPWRIRIRITKKADPHHFFVYLSSSSFSFGPCSPSFLFAFLGFITLDYTTGPV